MKKKIKRLIRFILAVILLPLYILGCMPNAAIEWMHDCPDWESWREYHFHHMTTWYRFK